MDALEQFVNLDHIVKMTPLELVVWVLNGSKPAFWYCRNEGILNWSTDVSFIILLGGIYRWFSFLQRTEFDAMYPLVTLTHFWLEHNKRSIDCPGKRLLSEGRIILADYPRTASSSVELRVIIIYRLIWHLDHVEMGSL